MYRIDWALLGIAGNLTRYQTTRPLVDADTEVESRWYLIRTWFAEDPLKVLPGAIRVRLRHFLDSYRLFLTRPADALVIHAFETYAQVVLFLLATGRRTSVIWNADGCVDKVPRKVRARTNLFVFWSNATLQHSLYTYPDIDAKRCRVLHPGIDLRRWPRRPDREPGERFRLLFVGGDFVRKGGDVLVEAYEKHLGDSCELDIATHSGFLPPEMAARIRQMPNVRLHLDLQPGSEKLKELFESADAFVLPTNHDLSPWVALEAMATGIPVIITPLWGIPDMVIDGETGLHIEKQNPLAIAGAVERLRTSPELRRKLIESGRRHVEKHFDARVNTPKLLFEVKQLVRPTVPVPTQPVVAPAVTEYVGPGVEAS